MHTHKYSWLAQPTRLVDVVMFWSLYNFAVEIISICLVLAILIGTLITSELITSELITSEIISSSTLGYYIATWISCTLWLRSARKAWERVTSHQVAKLAVALSFFSSRFKLTGIIDCRVRYIQYSLSRSIVDFFVRSDTLEGLAK